ncbi:PREDICTED: zinc finger protein with KRAB and SCAN domains 2-like [Vollenhovia emeryi]|uniref:zinc finger protein with KRAB and SCAN domains 2-like n=1 Tax=Vollenhovia emeryi TaxID=411798 RepID=UPI0005F3CD99|nr:PREDICTED: zinc finger protein with KRAB and SCAN domains 2-like [Vollenhovia emeryi]
MKRHNAIWGEIATQMKEADKKYIVTGLQCSTKFAGLKRTYKNIYEQNKKSGNSHSSWAFYSVMDSLIGEKAYIKPPAEASSEGPAPPKAEEPFTSGSSSPLSSENLRSAPKKRRVESILENYIDEMKHEKENLKHQRDEERKTREEERKTIANKK